MLYGRPPARRCIRILLRLILSPGNRELLRVTRDNLRDLLTMKLPMLILKRSTIKNR